MAVIFIYSYYGLQHISFRRNDVDSSRSYFQEHFDREYTAYLQRDITQNIAKNSRFYYLRHELQALTDMYHATGQERYLRQALNRCLLAIEQSQKNPRLMIRQGASRGMWPCFHHPSVDKYTGGHGQINDFQGSAGLLMVARLLKDHDYEEWKTIADFVERNIIEKWFLSHPKRSREDFKKDVSGLHLLRILEPARDKREQFACIAMDLHALGSTLYPYEQWAKLLIKLYLSERPELEMFLEENPGLRTFYDRGWSMTRQPSGALIWHVVRKRIFSVVQDTSHANRTVWLAAEAYDNQLISRDIIAGMVITLKTNIHFPQKGYFYFKNFIDGQDKPFRRNEPGRAGNLWTGWHRLATHDPELRALFVSLAYDLSEGGPNIQPRQAQNRTFPEAPLCFYAWAARLCMTENSSSNQKVRQTPNSAIN